MWEFNQALPGGSSSSSSVSRRRKWIIRHAGTRVEEADARGDFYLKYMSPSRGGALRQIFNLRTHTHTQGNYVVRCV